MLAGRYQIGELLGAGAMGEVYAARDVDGSHLAIKFLHEELSRLPDMRERFQREATNAREIHSPHVARVVAAGPSRKGLWIAYERLFGETLEQRLHRERMPPRATAVSVVAHALSGLSAAHSVGVVHRDIKPANIFLEDHQPESQPRACILDFGVSKRRGNEASASSHGLTGTADMLGSIRYVAPEQIGAAASADARADVFATGVVAFRMLTGAMPFAGKSTATMLVAKLNDRALTAAEVTGVSWPDSVETFFECALARDPAGRFLTAARMVEAWHALSGERLPEPQTFDAERVREHNPDEFRAETETHAGSTVRG